MSKTILYIQHANVIGGSVVSLRCLVQDAMRAGYKCIVICPSDEIAKYYEEVGAFCIIKNVVNLNHNSSFWYHFTCLDLLRLVRLFYNSIGALVAFKKVLDELTPDLVHLNSSVLPQYLVLSKVLGYRVVWHIRENVSNGYFGIRKSLLQAIGNKFADKVVYISENELSILGTQVSKSLVSYNYVDPEKFTPAPSSLKTEFIAISLGGVSEIKGTATIVASARYVPDSVKICIVGSADPRLKEIPTAYDLDILKLLAEPIIARKVSFVPPTVDIAPILGRASVLIFWGLVPHFPRPVYEAWMMEIPVIVYGKMIVNNDINEFTSVLVNENDPKALAEQLIWVSANHAAAADLARAGRARALEIFGKDNFTAINNMYEEILSCPLH